MKHCTSIVVLISCFLLIWGQAIAATALLDDFEDGDASGWTESYSGNGSTGVEFYNESLMAYAYQSAAGYHSLSKDFSYDPTSTLSFDMQATATYDYATGTPPRSKSGVTISLYDAFNVLIGSASLVYATHSTFLGANDNIIDNSLHNYSAFMNDYALLAGLNASDPIKKINLSFFARAETQWTISRAKVWFDNVSISNVPIPEAITLFGSGLLGLACIRRKKICNTTQSQSGRI